MNETPDGLAHPGNAGRRVVRQAFQPDRLSQAGKPDLLDPPAEDEARRGSKDPARRKPIRRPPPRRHYQD